MKTKPFDKKLLLKKETISNLEKKAMRSLRGGGIGYTDYYTCEPCDTRLQTCLPCPAVLTNDATCVTGVCNC